MQKNLTRAQVAELMPKAFKNFLYSQQCLKSYIINLLASDAWLSLNTDYITQYKELKKLYCREQCAIIYLSFNWKNTPEGHQYWDLIALRAQLGIKSK